ncbi:MAG TPA: hypothetical protein VI757_14845 [Bacteroidia bacterium]|nr:hypothetical protein [Bacteroidia bacterium]
MAQTEAQKNAFSDWMLELLKDADNAAAIAAANPTVTFDTPGTVALLTAKDAAYQGKEGAIVALEQSLRTANAAANDAMNDKYKASSNAADAVVGHVGKTHPLAILIRDKRDSMDNESPTPPTP